MHVIRADAEKWCRVCVEVSTLSLLAAPVIRNINSGNSPLGSRCIGQGWRGVHFVDEKQILPLDYVSHLGEDHACDLGFFVSIL